MFGFDVDGWLMGTEFLGTLASVLGTLLTNLVMGILGPYFGYTA